MLACVDHWFFWWKPDWAETMASTPTPTIIVASAVSMSVNPVCRVLVVATPERASTAAIAGPPTPPKDFLGSLKARFTSNYRIQPPTSELILKIGKMIAIAMNPTMEPMMMIMIGSIIPVTVLIASRRVFA